VNKLETINQLQKEKNENLEKAALSTVQTSSYSSALKSGFVDQTADIRVKLQALKELKVYHVVKNVPL
jgi:hypothetical protein